MTLVPLRMACTPRADVLVGGLTDNHFAAQLDKVVRNPEQYPVYGDADQFFAITYPTSGLRKLLTKTFGRVTGRTGVVGENGVLRPTTSFGGGKTHDLTAVYHLARGHRPAGLEEFLDISVLPAGPVQVAALVGDALDPVAGVMTNGHRSLTLWGEMAAQLGDDAFAAMAANDEARSAPGTHTILEAFGQQPTIVIIDEIAQYLRQVTSSGDENVRRTARAIPVFLKNLFEVAADPSNKVIVIVTLAARTNAFGVETDEMTEMLDEAAGASTAALAEATDVLARSIQPSAVIRPADDTEIGEILKRRLFERIDPSAAKAAAEAYAELYETLGKNEVLAGGAEHPSTYSVMVEKYYPFHPELVRVLDKRLGDIPQFQRARGALKLLAEVVSHVYSDGDDTAVINIGDIDYSDEPVLSHLTDGIGRSEFEGVAKADFAGQASHAAALDQRVFPGKSPYATRVAQTVFTHSLEMKLNAGASRNDWILGTIRPGEDPSVFEKALTESDKTFWHLGFDGARWRFNIEPNVNAIIESEKQNIQNTRVAAVLDDLIARAFANDGAVTSILFPSGPSDLPDQAALRVSVLHHNVLTVDSKTAENPPALLVDMLDKVGSSGSPRKYRNGVVFVVADTNLVDTLKDRVRAQIAAEVLAADGTRLAQFGDEIRKKIDAYRNNAVLEARVAITRCYKHVFYPTNDKAHGYLHHRELPAQQQGDTKTATAVVLAMLTDEGKIRTERFTYSYLKQRTWPDTQPSVTTQAVVDWFWIDHASPIVRNIPLIREAIIDGIRNDNWVYYDASTGKAHTASTMAGLSVEISSDTEIMTLGEATNRGLLVRKPTQADLKAVFSGTITSGAQLRNKLEALCGGEPSKSDVLDLLATAVLSNEYKWLVITDTEPAQGVRALTPTQVKEKGLDGLFVMTRDHADQHAVEVPIRKVTGKTFTASGPGGAAIQSITDQINDFTIQTVTKLSLKVTADDVRGTADVDLLVMALGMLPKHAITVDADLRAEYNGLTGGLKFYGSAARSDFQALFTHLSRTLKTAQVVAGDLIVNVTFTPAVTLESGEWVQLHKVIKDLQIQNASISAEVAR
jgi:Protein of unknown function (DUF499)